MCCGGEHYILCILKCKGIIKDDISNQIYSSAIMVLFRYKENHIAKYSNWNQSNEEKNKKETPTFQFVCSWNILHFLFKDLVLMYDNV